MWRKFCDTIRVPSPGPSSPSVQTKTRRHRSTHTHTHTHQRASSAQRRLQECIAAGRPGEKPVCAVGCVRPTLSRAYITYAAGVAATSRPCPHRPKIKTHTHMHTQSPPSSSERVAMRRALRGPQHQKYHSKCMIFAVCASSCGCVCGCVRVCGCV